MQQDICRQMFWDENMEQMAAAQQYETGKSSKAHESDQIMAHDAAQQPDHRYPCQNGKGNQAKNEITLYQSATVIPALLLRQATPCRQNEGLQIQLFVQRQRRHKSCNQSPKDPFTAVIGRIERSHVQHDHGKGRSQAIDGTDSPTCNVRIPDGKLPTIRDAEGKICIGKGHSGSILGLFRASLTHIAATSWYVQSFLWHDQIGRRETV